jgi:hypothetical protein
MLLRPQPIASVPEDTSRVARARGAGDDPPVPRQAGRSPSGGGGASPDGLDVPARPGGDRSGRRRCRVQCVPRSVAGRPRRSALARRTCWRPSGCSTAGSSSLEGTLSQDMRACGRRRPRSRGLAKPHVQHGAIATAIPVDRLIAWLDERPRAQPRPARVAALAPACLLPLGTSPVSDAHALSRPCSLASWTLHVQALYGYFRLPTAFA